MIGHEYSVVVALQRLSPRPLPFNLAADAAARAALALRFDLIALDRLEAVLDVARKGEGAQAVGRLLASATQRCVISQEPVPAQIDMPVVLDFMALRTLPDSDELELEEDALDAILFEGDSIDLGEAVAQCFALALDPYPRASDAAIAAARRHILSEEEAAARAVAAKAAQNPFAVLKRD